MKKNGAPPGEERPEMEISISRKAFLEYYLLTGTLPWWSNEKEMNDPEKVFEQLLLEDRDGLKKLFAAVAAHAYVRKRLVYGFSEYTIHAIIYLVEPAQAVFIIEYQKDISAIQKKEQLIKAEASEFDKAVLIFILDYLFEDKGSHFNRKMFVKSTLASIAARFNISFGRLLVLFDEAIKATNELVKYNDTLPSLIKELSKEIAYIESTLGNLAGTEENGVTETKTVNKKYDLVGFYLLTGSFPHDTPFMQRDELLIIFRELIALAPQLMKELFLKTGDKENVRKRLAHELNDEVIKEIIQLTEPAEAEFILNYASVTLKIQAQKSIVKTQEPEFKKMLWEFILTFLFSERGSVFNKKMFLESNIRNMARHYNIEFAVLLAFLAQGVSEEFNAFAESSSLFYMLIDILKETNEEKKLISNETSAGEKNDPIRVREIETRKNGVDTDAKNSERDADSLVKKIIARNSVLFWLEHGYLPWWSENETSKSPEVLLDELIALDPSEAALLFEYAIANSLISAHFFNAHSHYLFKVAEYMKDGGRAMDLIKIMTQLNRKITYPVTETGTSALLALALVETYRERKFRSFDQQHFLSNYLYKLQLAIGLSTHEMTELMLTLLKGIENTEQKKTVTAFIRSGDFGSGSARNFYESRSDFSEKAVLEIVSGSVQSHQEADLSFEKNALMILEYFLVKNKLPETLTDISGTRLDDFIFRLILLLNRYNSTAFSQLLSRDNFSAFSRIKLHDIFFQKQAPETVSVKVILAGYFQRDLIHYITENGVRLRDEMKLDALFDQLQGLSNDHQRKKVLITLLNSQAFGYYISRNHQGDDYYDTLKILGSEKAVSLLKRVSYVFNLVASDSFERENLGAFLREFSFIWFSQSGDPGFSEKLFIRSFLEFISQKRNWNMVRLSEQFKSVRENSAVFIPTDLVLLIAETYTETLYFSDDRKYREFLRESYAGTAEKTLMESLPAYAKEEKKSVEIKPDEKENTARKLLLNEQIYIQNAGLILLHPFLPVFFARTGLMLDGKFSDPDKMLRAPYLLQYVVTGNEECLEAQLVLNKILCGINVEEALPGISALTEQEKQVCDEMLAVVIQQWDKMKNTSKEGFRASFLQRNGAFTLTEEAWVLKIEQRGYDILLQTLPWSTGMIKTSWMDKPLIVEWI